jgi:hypothetical protein
MRTLIFGVMLLAVVAAGSSYTSISSSLAASRDAKTLTFDERFAPALWPGSLTYVARGTNSP